MNDDKPPSRSFFDKIADVFRTEPQDKHDLIEVLRSARDDQLIKPDSLSMMEGVLQVANMQVRDIMVPRSQMSAIQEDAKLSEILPMVIETKHSRYPVFGENRDDIEGIMLAKELLVYAAEKGINLSDSQTLVFDIKNVLRPAVVVPESKKLDVLLKEFRMSRNHMAVVVDEYGGVSGIVTIEDVLEQIVGDIEDEFDIDEDEGNIRPHANGDFIVKAQTDIEDFNEALHAKFSDEEFDTVGGFVVNQFGHMPENNETVLIEPFEFTVLNADERRVHLLKVRVIETDDAEKNE